MNKSEIRKKIIKLRKKNFSKNLSIDNNKFLKILKQKKIKNKIIGGYYPYNYEMDIIGILRNLEKKNYKISIPKISNNNQMNFFEWSLKDPLSINNYGIPEPTSKKIIYPDILLIPLLAFDDELNRLGYGGGYYDRYLSKVLKIKKIVTVGIGFSFQKVKKIPTKKNDIRLDYVMTDKNFFK